MPKNGSDEQMREKRREEKRREEKRREEKRRERKGATNMHQHEMSDARDERNFSGDEIEEVEEDPKRTLANEREELVLLAVSLRSQSELFHW
jgi:hypothetical protein